MARSGRRESETPDHTSLAISPQPRGTGEPVDPLPDEARGSAKLPETLSSGLDPGHENPTTVAKSCRPERPDNVNHDTCRTMRRRLPRPVWPRGQSRLDAPNSWPRSSGRHLTESGPAWKFGHLAHSPAPKTDTDRRVGHLAHSPRARAGAHTRGQEPLSPGQDPPRGGRSRRSLRSLLPNPDSPVQHMKMIRTEKRGPDHFIGSGGRI